MQGAMERGVGFRQRVVHRDRILWYTKVTYEIGDSYGKQ